MVGSKIFAAGVFTHQEKTHFLANNAVFLFIQSTGKGGGQVSNQLMPHRKNADSLFFLSLNSAAQENTQLG